MSPMSPRLLRPRANTAFTPRSLANLALWYDGADTSTFTLNGSNISEWRDKSGANRHASQASAASQPAYGTWSGGLRAASNADLRNGFLSVTNGLSLTRNIGAFCVSTVIRVSFETTGQLLFQANSGAANARVRMAVNETAVAAGALSAIGRRLDANSVDGAVGGSSPIANADYVVTAIWDFTNARALIYRNGTLLAEDTAFQTAGNTSDTDSSAIQIMGLGAFFFGLMGEFVAYTRRPSDSERVALERYLGRKWGITIA
jgi:hypothetical protein